MGIHPNALVERSRMGRASWLSIWRLMHRVTVMQQLLSAIQVETSIVGEGNAGKKLPRECPADKCGAIVARFWSSINHRN